MRRSPVFKKSTTYITLVSGFGALFIYIPIVGLVLLFIVATIGGVLASLLIGIDLLRYANNERLKRS
jgi:hypothetical protein